MLLISSVSSISWGFYVALGDDYYLKPSHLCVVDVIFVLFVYEHKPIYMFQLARF